MDEATLRELMQLPSETEWLEFKEAKQQENFDDIGKCFSAISNESSIAGHGNGWLIFGVSNNVPRQFVNSNFRLTPPGLDKLKNEIAQLTNHSLTFSNIFELEIEGNRVLMFEIPAAMRGTPTTWRQVPYGRIHESIGYLAGNKFDTIRSQTTDADWSAVICESASLDDLDLNAIKFGRARFTEKNPRLQPESVAWDNATFLNKARLTVDGKLTRAAIILLGKPESIHHLSPTTAQLTWLLRDSDGNTKDYTHFEPPFLLAVDKIFNKVRNLTYRYLPDATLFPTEVDQYDNWVIREALHNCIAHQDYSLAGQITLIEAEDSLLFTNPGEFIPGSVDEVLQRNAPTQTYRNRCLAQAMVNLTMIDTIGSGIRKMYTMQRRRFFPLPEYDFSQRGEVSVRIYGRILDERYTRVLMAQTELDLADVVALDKVQKGHSDRLTDAEFKSLKKQKLIEGRRTKLRVSENIATITDTLVDYMNRRGIDIEYCQKIVVELLEKQTQSSRAEFEEILVGKLSEDLNSEQKKKFVENRLQELRRKGIIRPVLGKRGRGTPWELVPESPNLPPIDSD